MPRISETSSITEAAATAAKKSGRMLIQHISPGWGSSGYYSADVLEQAVADKVIPAGTHMYADHPTDLEAIERPVRSIKDLMAVTVEDGRLATAADVATWGADLGAVVSEVQVVPQYAEFLEIVAENIGASIRGEGTGQVGTAEGRQGLIFESIAAPVRSVDFVTRAGRGGKVLSVMESAKATTRAIAHGISEATVNDTREALHTALRDEYAGEKTYVWVRDFDETTVWFEVEDADDSGIFAQAYAMSDAGATLSGDRTEVQVKTQYVPVARPGSTTTSTEESKEDTMGNISIEESEHQRLVTEAGRVATLEQERDTEKAGRIKAEEALASRDRADAAVKVITDRAKEAGVTFTALEAKGLMTSLPLKESGELDTEKFTKAVDEAAAEKAQESGAGRVSGFGGTTTGGTATEISEADIDKAVAGAFGRQIKEN